MVSKGDVFGIIITSYRLIGDEQFSISIINKPLSYHNFEYALLRLIACGYQVISL